METVHNLKISDEIPGIFRISIKFIGILLVKASPAFHSFDMSIFHRYLQALQCPIIDQINDQSIHQPSTQELLLLWLEDRKIREFEIEDRVPLRLSKHNGDLQTWSSHINKYGEAIGCPYEWVVQGSNSKYIPDANKQFLFWLASRAIALDYEDTVETDEVTSCNNHDINSGEEVMEIDEDLKDENYQRIVQKCEKLGDLVGIQRKQGEPIVGIIYFSFNSFLLLLPLFQ